MTHTVKADSAFYKEMLEKGDGFQLVKDDRPYKVGEILMLQEWSTNHYTGKEESYEITSILKGDAKHNNGIRKGFCFVFFKLTSPEGNPAK